MDAALLAAALTGLAGLTAAPQLQRERRRTAGLRALADERGWAWTPRDDAEAARRGLPGAPGSTRRACDVLRGSCGGRALTALTLAVTGPSAGATRTDRYGVLAVRLPAPVPDVALLPVSVLDRLRAPGVVLESEDVGQRYRLLGEPRLVADLLPPRSLELLAGRPVLTLRLRGDEALAWWPGRLDVPRLLTHLATVDGLLDGVPQRVWRELGARA